MTLLIAATLTQRRSAKRRKGGTLTLENKTPGRGPKALRFGWTRFSGQYEGRFQSQMAARSGFVHSKTFRQSFGMYRWVEHAHRPKT